MSIPTTTLARELVRMACGAPSIHNTQPWAWRLVDPATIELRADRSRQLAATDPEGRALVISCGAALHHLVVAAEGFGLATETRLLPDADDPDYLAQIRLEPGETTLPAVEAMAAIENRITDRRSFTDWGIPGARLGNLAATATGWGAHAIPVTDPGLAARVRLLAREARTTQQEDAQISEEQAAWIDHSPDDGVPVRNAYPHQREGARPTEDRFTRGPDRTGARGVPPSDPGDAFVLVFTSRDDEASWLAAGQALSALWTRATLDGFSLRPDTQVIEVAQTRQLLRRHLLDDLGQPQVLVHVGWQESSRPPQRPTPRRSLEDVLLPGAPE